MEYNIDQLDGVGPVTVKKLKEFGVTSLFDICVRGAREIAEITGTAKSKADTWVFNAQKILEDAGLIRKTDMTTLELFDYQKDIDILPVKCEAVDDLMSGGVKPECTYEVYGEFGSGKTQFCLALTVEAIARGDNVVWVDCEDTFKPNRVAEILKERGYAKDMEEAMKFMEKIDYFFTPNTEQLMGTINALSDVLLEKKPRLVVVDGGIGQFREEYLGRGTLADRQNQKPPWYKALGGGIEAQAIEIFAAKSKAEAMRKELKDYISVMYGPSKWQEILEIEAKLRKQKKEHEHRQEEIKQTIIEWTSGIFLFLCCVGFLFGFVWLGTR